MEEHQRQTEARQRQVEEDQQWIEESQRIRYDLLQQLIQAAAVIQAGMDPDDERHSQ